MYVCVCVRVYVSVPRFHNAHPSRGHTRGSLLLSHLLCIGYDCLIVSRSHHVTNSRIGLRNYSFDGRLVLTLTNLIHITQLQIALSS